MIVSVQGVKMTISHLAGYFRIKGPRIKGPHFAREGLEGVIFLTCHLL